MIFEKIVSDMAYLFFRFDLTHQKDRADPNILTSLHRQGSVMLANHSRFHRLSRWIHCGNFGSFFMCTLLAGFTGLAGCSICPSPYDYDYGTYGTKTPRTDMRHGRVGSLFSDPALTQGQLAAPGDYSGYGLDEPIMLQEGVVVDEQIVGPGEIIIQ